MKRLISVALVLVILVFCLLFCVYSESLLSVSAKSAVLIDSTVGSVIFSKNEDERLSMASTTKIMTALILCEQADLDEQITVTNEMVMVEGTSLGLQKDDRISYRDLLYGLLLASGNDAANAVAISIGGSIDNFAKMMNKKAKEIGLNNTNFVTPSGLDAKEHYTTAYDMAILTLEAMKNTHFANACSSETATLEFGNPPYKRTIKNHNKLLKLYDGAIGVKTGFTKKSGRCLVSCAEKDGKRVIAVTLNASDDWNDHIKMLNYGLDCLETRTIDCSESLPSVDVNGSDNKLKIYVDSVTLSLLSDDFEKITYKIDVTEPLNAPIIKGERVGSVKLCIGDKIVASTDCFAAENIDVKIEDNYDYLFWLRRLIAA